MEINRESSIIKPFLALLKSRKFLVAVLGILSAWAVGAPLAELLDLIKIAILALAGSIAFEDGMEKRGR